ncbi:AraC family transcriptional regulator [Arcobacter arenosus]|uniref:AraC family transcriptional regulator n=1 Tax=Arcobacter arenosus TaxID=2576037 RepID=A0A5R8Y520_9BACT|nr:AraC family transcriptional regulator [Arcobacter arenosus]TLP41078.1 AraC family transcriptional regulator [Arcobacter arenosus]
MAEISSLTFHYVLKSLEKITSIKVDEMLQLADIPSEVISCHENKIDSKKLSSIFRYCAKKSNNPYLALHIGQATSYQSLGILGYLLLNTKNLKQIIEKFNTYQKLISGHFKFYFNDDGTYYKLAIYINENPMIPVPNFHAQVHLSSIVSILSQILGEKVFPDYTCFSQKAEENLEEYIKIFGNNISFEKQENAIFFKKDRLNIPVKNSNSSMLEYFENQANKILDEQKQESWYFKVEKEILKNIGVNEITIELIGKNLNLSPRTLQNYLKAESKTFRKALDSIRQKLANHYIKNTKMDLGTISIFLGYSEPSSFFRAYRRWYNTTPKQKINQSY